MARATDDRPAPWSHVRGGGRRRSGRGSEAARRSGVESFSDDSSPSVSPCVAVGTDLSRVHVDAERSIPQVRRTGSKMARTKTKSNPYQAQIEALHKKQNELLDS